MQAKFDLRYLPADLLNKTVEPLSNKDLISIASTCSQHLNFFNPLLNKNKLLHFLNHVIQGNHGAVQKMLAGDWSLFYRKGQIIDHAGRIFENISGFEYALWALDKHMWITMIECLPADEAGIRVYHLLKEQYNHLNTCGITYSIDQQIITEPHFSFANTIIKQLQKQVKMQKTSLPRNHKAVDKQWREEVGKAQRLLPIHVVSEYCSNTPFDPVPSFNFQSQTGKQFYNGITGKVEGWFDSDSRLAIDFALFKGCNEQCIPSSLGGAWVESEQDLVAMLKLYEVRQKDYIRLKSLFGEQGVGLDNRHYFQII